LPGCVHTSVSATGTNNADYLIGNFRQRILDVCLHAIAAALTLPAVVRCAVVLKT